MAIKVNTAGVSHAKSLIRAGKVDRDSDWSFEAADGNKILGDGKWSEYKKWFLAEDTEANEETKERYKFPYGKNGKVYRRGVIAAKQRAAQQGYSNIVRVADELLEMIDKEEEEKAFNGQLTYRKMPVNIDKGVPLTLNEEERSVEVVGATENPVDVFDWERGEIVKEVLLMEGCKLPPNRQVPLLDTHMRMNTSNVIGSFRNMRIENGQLVGRVYFASTPDAEIPYQKVKEGHLTDFSIGYRVAEFIYIPEGSRQQIGVREFQGPVRVTTKWIPKELSLCPIGADENAKARAILPERQETKEVKMEDKIREYLVKKGLSPEATEEEAYTFLERLEMEAAKGVVEQAVAAERNRVLEIKAICERANMSDLAEEFIKNGKTIDEVRREVLERIIEQAPKPEKVLGRVEVVESAVDRFREAAVDAICMRAGMKMEKPAAGAESLMGMTLREIAKEALRIANQPVHGNPLEMVKRALSTSDLPNILANVANKSLMEGYETASETWQIWCATGSVSDFKTNTLVRLGETDDLEEVPEGREYKYSSIGEIKEEFKIATYGKMFAITRQTIINDDLNALVDIPRMHGEAAARKIGDIAYAILTTNPTMGDGVALFHSSHNNLGTAGAVSETTIAEAIKKMKMQKDIGGKRRLNITPQYFIAPVSIEGTAEVFFSSKYFVSNNAAATRENIYAGKFIRVYEPRLDDSSTTAWYLAGPKGKTVTVFFLNGVQTPYLESRQGWDVDGIEYKVRIDAGAKAVDWRALFKNAGA